MRSERPLQTRTGGRAATTGVIPGDVALSVGNPGTPLPQGWEWRLLTDIARLETGHTPSRRHPEWWGGSIPWVGIRDATGNHGTTIYETEQYTNELGIRNSSARVLPATTVCLSRTASVGYVVVMGVPMATSQDFVNWVCGPQLDHRYLMYVLLAERSAFRRFSSGTTHQTIYFPEVKAFHVAIPPRALQTQIADVLGSIDDRIDLLRQTNASLESIAHALFKSWFIDFDPVRAKAEGREPEGMDAATAALFPAEFEESALGLIPKGWRVGTLVDAVEVNPGRRLIKGAEAMYLDMANAPTVGHRPLLRPVPRAFGSGCKFVNGDALLAKITPCLENGKSAYVDFLADGEIGWGSTEFIVLRARPVLPAFGAYLLARQEAFRQFAIQAMTGTSGRQRVELTRLQQYTLVLPPDSALAEATEPVFSSLQSRIAANDEQAKTLATLRDTLLPRLISGKLRLPAAGEQVEDALA